MTEVKNVTLQKQFEIEKPKFERLRTTVWGILQNKLLEDSIEFLSIQSRVKNATSFQTKCERKEYADPFNDCTDIAAFRVIVFLDREIKKAEHSIRELFQIDEENSIDRLHPERVDSVGYKSLHLICSLGKTREKLPEYNRITGLRFEIQIRTVLQHAWAEIEHKRNYKGEHALPADLQHRLMVTSGALELVDREFSSLADAADLYAEELAAGSESANSDRLSELALIELMSDFLKKANLIERPEIRNLKVKTDDLINELKTFNVNSVGDLRNFISSPDIAEKLITLGKKQSSPYHLPGFYRSAMIISDPKKFFHESVASHPGISLSFYPLSFLEKVSSVLEGTDVVEVCRDAGVGIDTQG
nr:hypothetical protein [uncultured Ruegeria sp.]